jgi:imidazolonepropionase-like amidohydrolase
MKTILIRSVLGALAAAAVSGAASAQTVLIQNARVHTVGPQGTIENGDVLIQNGVIEAVGVDLPQPAGATIVNASGRVVTPGIIAPFSSLGLEELSLDGEANDAEVDGDFPLSASLDVVDAYNPSTSVIPVNRAGGVTRALTAPQPGGKLFGGHAAVIDLSGRVASVTRARAAQIVAMGYGGARRAGDSRMGSWELLRETLDAALAYASGPREYELRPRDPRFEIGDLRALGPVVSGAEPMIVAVNSAQELRNLIRLRQQYSVRVIALGASEGWRVARELAAAGIPVIIDPLYNLPGGFEDLSATLYNAQRLQAAGVSVAFYNPQGSATHNLRLLPQMAGNAVANGMPYPAALAALTINPARMFGIDQRLGSLEKGKAADVVVWDGDPLEVSSRPLAVFIDGVAMNMENRQTKLRDRYRDLSRGDLPFAYRGAKP